MCMSDSQDALLLSSGDCTMRTTGRKVKIMVVGIRKGEGTLDLH